MKDHTLYEIYKLIGARKFSIRELHQMYKNTIREHNPSINAIISFNPNIEHQINQLEDIPPDDRGILKGIPFVVKDSIFTTCCPTTCGNPDLKDFIPEKNADCVSKLLIEGGLVLGKTNTPTDTLDVQTFNPLFGITNNPHNVAWTAGGSSGGTAAAIASGMAHIGLGSDLAGSLRIPASFCSIYSLRPTESLIPTSGHIPPEPHVPVMHSELVIGPMASSLFGIELMMSALNPSEEDKKGLENNSTPSFLITPEFSQYPVDSSILQAIMNLKDTFRFSSIDCTIEAPELSFELIRQTHKELSQMLLTPNIKQNELEFDISETLENREIIREEQLEILEQFNAWILPVCSVLPFPHNLEHKPLKVNNEKIDYWKAMISYSTLFSASGFPVLTIPISFSKGKPIGIQLIGKPNEDYTLISIAKQVAKDIYENKKGHWLIDLT